MHIIIDMSARIMLDYRITHTYRGDTRVMLDILKNITDPLYGNIGDACFDSAYLREICYLISEMSGTLYINPTPWSNQKVVLSVRLSLRS